MRNCINLDTDLHPRWTPPNQSDICTLTRFGERQPLPSSGDSEYWESLALGQTLEGRFLWDVRDRITGLVRATEEHRFAYAGTLGGDGMDGAVVITLIISGIIGFFILAGAIGVGVSAGMTSAHKHIRRWEERQGNSAQANPERKTYKPSEQRASRAAPVDKAIQPPKKPSNSKRGLLKKGDLAVVTKDVMIGDEISFRKGQQVRIDDIKENAKYPQFKYAVRSEELGSSFLMSDDQLMKHRPSAAS